MLNQSGLNDYTIAKDGVSIYTFEFNDEDTNHKILDGIRKFKDLLKNKGEKPNVRKSKIQSRYLDRQNRQIIYREWLHANGGTENRELYNLLSQASEKNETQEKVDNLNEEIENIRKEFVKKYGSSISNWGNKYLEFNKETSKHQ